MDDDGFAVHSRRRRGTIRDRDRESFLREPPRYAGTDEDFERAHAQRYGREEGLGLHGKHHHGSARFPRGSEREKMHTDYSNSTGPRDKSRKAYENGLKAAEMELRRMSIDEQRYYKQHTGGLAPYQHGRLEPRAQDYSNNSYKNAKSRIAFLEKFPHGYHTAQEQKKHEGYADWARDEYTYAGKQAKFHGDHGPNPADDRRDPFGRQMSRRQRR